MCSVLNRRIPHFKSRHLNAKVTYPEKPKNDACLNNDKRKNLNVFIFSFYIKIFAGTGKQVPTTLGKRRFDLGKTLG